jgi:hypothetical protein
MKKLIALTVLMIGAQALAFEQTDYTCVSNCTSQGTLYGLCKDRCTYDSSPKIQQTDFGCVSQCTAQGNQYGLCQQRCSY